MKNILVFPCGSEVGLEVYEAFKNNVNFQLIGLSSVNDHGSFIYENYIGGIDFVGSQNFLNTIKKIIKERCIDIIYPTMDSVISYFKEHENELGIPIVGSNSEITKICLSKKNTYRVLENEILTPKVFNNLDEILNFPVFLKPDVGYGSRGAKVIFKKEEISADDFLNNVISEYLPGEEYTIDCFTDKNGELKFVRARKRGRIRNGISVNTKTDLKLTHEFLSIAQKINSKLKNIRGAWFFQIKRNENKQPVLLEIASRIAGSSSIHRINGINLPLLSVYDLLDYRINIIENCFEVELDRALNNKFKIELNYNLVYFDYDDTILINNKVNTDAIAFIFYCINNGIKLTLLTKHKGNLVESLRYHKLEQLFDHIIQINSEDEKSKYIDNIKYSPIFIDDSYKEREKVKAELKIPVFSIEVIKNLII